MTATHLSNRSVIRLSARESSEDIASFLQGLVTNDVTGDLPVYAALLSAQGKAMFDFLVWSDPSTGSGRAGDLLLDCEAGVAADLAKRLSLYRLRRAIDIAIDESLSMHWSLEEHPGASPDPRLAELGYRWIAPKDDNEAANEAWLAHRLSLGVPEGQAELGEILWLETNAIELNGVSFDKGCYVGQENTARMNWRQKVNRRLVVVPLSASQDKRRKVAYDDLGLAVDHLRVDDIDREALPDWQKHALATPD
ncbi:CAF17-like 4Fe-4S cluster assembly/insertion protein YgfZ [Altererythrobacter lutimaris]|uniref:Folate-binding protein YgfZ n=1 Tax=Altererythrobacter lutimaris TaxID=2743979 RepID=A0A850H9C9_9SPHN|nr:folate-binding protein YgfZ [Altererythrobacter lutimaris]NVE94503.1 folate-binding protein YgfZ [Altererythrobacter lutimaris]